MSIFDLPRRIIDKIAVRPTDRCWEWHGGHVPSGYGKVRYGPKHEVRSVHVVTYESEFGPVPLFHELDHVKERCALMRGCCNPWHLEPVTHRENILRGQTIAAAHAAKTHCPQGHPYSGANLVTSSWPGQACNRKCRVCVNTGQRERRMRRQYPEDSPGV